MANDIWVKIVGAVIAFVVPGTLGYFVATIKNYKKREDTQQEALKCLLRGAITSKYYVYSELKSIPLYEKENLNYMYEQYAKMGGNSYISKIMDEINQLPIKK